MGISIWQLLIILAIVLVLFGAKRLRNVGSDLGGAIKGFKHAMHESEEEAAGDKKPDSKEGGHVIEGEVTKRDKDKV
ncbi:MAG: twin-arginine translocase TatA/TatE family subunit [Gammaproteobacteria bacterium]|jgi:sec-independent protein translocase protein TatA|nr:twin-arginine translocase TatA/TatE family subunit [Gammaproteobacteria bacterium]